MTTLSLTELGEVSYCEIAVFMLERIALVNPRANALRAC
jgi:hypothetical protein